MLLTQHRLVNTQSLLVIGLCLAIFGAVEKIFSDRTQQICALKIYHSSRRDPLCTELGMRQQALAEIPGSDFRPGEDSCESVYGSFLPHPLLRLKQSIAENSLNEAMNS